MKKIIALLLALSLCAGILLCGCTPKAEKTPDKYEKIRWISYDYSFCINPSDDCKGYYKFGDKKYNIQVTFESTRVTAVDTDNSGKELFNGDWMYEKNDDGEDTLFIHNISFNTKDYSDLKTNYAEFVTLRQEKL